MNVIGHVLLVGYLAALSKGAVIPSLPLYTYEVEVYATDGIPQGTIGRTPNSVHMIFIAFSRDSWGL